MLTDGKVKLHEPGHKYYHEDGRQFTSVSAVLESFKVFFDAPMIALRSAGGDKIKAEMIERQWKETNRIAREKGTLIHNELEKYSKDGFCSDRFMPLSREIHSAYFKDYYKQYDEEVFYSEDYMVAGTVDKVAKRQRKVDGAVVDIFDYKTNVITLDSIKRRKDDGQIIKHYNRYLLHALKHTEESKYIIYSNQLNIYAFMALFFKLRIGRLGIIEIDYNMDTDEFTHRLIPVPFYAVVGKSLLNDFRSRKALPGNYKKEFLLEDQEDF